MFHRGKGIGNLFAELSRRKVIRVAVTYGIVGFAVIEAADIIVDAINLPPRFVAIVIVAIFLGFPVAIVLAWSYEVVPDPGPRGTTSDDPGEYAAESGKSAMSPVRALILAAAAVIIGVAWYEMRQPDGETDGVASGRYVDSVAVMPLENLTGDTAYDHVGIGITEEIITHLARIPPLKVISRHSVQAADAQNLTTPQIANALGVRHVIEGSIQLDGDRIRVALQHIDAQFDAHLWAENLDGSLSDIIRVQEDIARFATTRIVDQIPGLTLPTINTHVDLGPGQKAYQEGKSWLGQRTPEGLRNAIMYFEQAIEMDRSYAPAYADLASAYTLALSYRYDIGVDPQQVAARAMLLSNKALELNRNLASGHAARGLLGIQVGQSSAAIAADFDRAEKLSPNSASIPSWRSLAQAQLGNTGEAFAEATRAVALDPLAPARQIALANVAFQLGRYEEAIAAARIATALEPKLIRGRAIEARSQILLGRPEACADLLLSAYRVLRATCLEAAGRPEDARTIIERVLEEIDGGRNSVPDYSEIITYEELATYYAVRGDAIAAQNWVTKALATSPAGIEFRVLDSPLFDPVREHHDFRSSVSAIRADLYDQVRRRAESLRSPNQMPN